MRIDQAFDPIEVGEIDTFGFDFTYDMGDAVLLAGSFYCNLAPFQNIIDTNPQSHVFSSFIATQIALKVPPGGKQVIRNGNFVLASIGGFTGTVMGGTYILGATANLSDGRILDLSATVLVKSTFTN